MEPPPFWTDLKSQPRELMITSRRAARAPRRRTRHVPRIARRPEQLRLIGEALGHGGFLAVAVSSKRACTKSRCW